MGFLRRLVAKTPAAPEWASYFTGDEYQTFIDVVRADFGRRGAPFTIDDGVVHVSGDPQELGLSNLAQMCHAADRAAWPSIVATHFANLRAITGRDLDALAADFDQVRPLLRVRLLADESMGGMSSVDLPGSRRSAPGILLALVYDFPDSTQSVENSHIEAWPFEPDAVWQIAIDNVGAEPQPIRREMTVGAGSFTMAVGDSFYVATRALRLADELPPGTSDAVFATPNRHVLLWHAIRDVSVLGAIQGMAGIASQTFREGPGSISDQLYWWHAGAIVQLPVHRRGEALDFMPPDDFVALLNTLPAP